MREQAASPGDEMASTDLCPCCLRQGCPGTVEGCAVRSALMSAQTMADVRAADAPPSNAVFGDGRGTLPMCGFCYGAGGHRVPCHGCGVIGPIMVQR